MVRWPLTVSLVVAACGPSVAGSPEAGSSTGEVSTSMVDPSEPTASGVPPAEDTTGTTAPTSTSVVDDTGSDSETTGGPPTREGPSRILVFYTPHGFYQDQAWSGTGQSFVLGSMLEPLEPWSDHLLIVEGISSHAVDPEGIDVMDNHSTASAGLLTGGLLGTGVNGEATDFNPHYAGGPSLDVVLGEALAGETLLSSVHLGVRDPSPTSLPLGVSYLGLDQPNPPWLDPSTTFELMFGGLEDPALDSLHDAVAGIAADDPVGLLDAQLALAAAAFGHDVTRVQLVTVDVGIPSIRWTELGLRLPFHEVLVSEPSLQAEPVYVRWGQSLAALVGQLEATPSASGASLLDSTLVVWLSELGSVPAAHSRNAVLVVVVDVSGTMTTGRVAEVDADQADLAATLAAALGVELGAFGHPSLGAAPIAELLEVSGRHRSE
ncbi:DUF1552 domain-containing protein [Paraliomyxa miuraensis]|uniref:DUF1552 domain-containing protein n=1 Tax=Paraliomyxa miuraensis TaxID=376150 RepID=UPI00225881D0|nr:DUF1552 domain-containing protein [Paraliomyxa miuraensis]